MGKIKKAGMIGISLICFTLCIDNKADAEVYTIKTSKPYYYLPVDSPPLTIKVNTTGQKINRIKVKGKCVPVVNKLPKMYDGTRGEFVIKIGSTSKYDIYRYSWHTDDMYDSSLIWGIDKQGKVVKFFENEKDAGSRGSMTYFWDVETEYVIENGYVKMIKTERDSDKIKNNKFVDIKTKRTVKRFKLQ